MGAPYRRVYKHTGTRGKEKYVECEYCKKSVPRYKAIVRYRGFSINDPLLKDVKTLSLKRKIYICPSCARFRGIVEIGRSRKSRTPNRNR